MDAELKARRASSFGAAAREYAEHRPGYPDAAVDWALAPVRSRRVVRVLDLAAGTGRVTEALLRAEVDVIAVEPDAEMRAAMLERVYGVAVLAGTAEDIPLPDARVDAVVVGQAFHWFDHQRALPEIARVLNPGGVLAAMWNGEDLRVPWVRGYTEAAGFREEPQGRRAASASGANPEAEADSGADSGAGAKARAEAEAERPLIGRPEFERPRWADFEHSHRRTVDSLLATVRTYSALLVLPAGEQAERLRRIRGYLESRPEAAGGEFDLPLVTKVARAIRR